MSLNEYVVKYGDSEGVYFVTQCFVNGWPKGLSNNMAVDIRDGKVSWKVISGRLYVNGADICAAPNGWDSQKNIYNRENTYNEAIISFK